MMEHFLHPQPGYPFSLRISIEYALTDNGLRVRTTARNRGTEPCPYGSGAHPYLTLGTAIIDSLILGVPGRTVLRSDERGLPIGTEAVEHTEYNFQTPRQIGSTNRMRAYAKELIGTAPDVAVADSTPAALALHRESRTTPIIFVQGGNPVASGLVANLARPGGNLTGFTNYVPAMAGKWLELLKEVAPGLARVAALFNPKTHTGQYWDVLEAATQSLGVTFRKAAVEDDDGVAHAVEASR